MRRCIRHNTSRHGVIRGFLWGQVIRFGFSPLPEHVLQHAGHLMTFLRPLRGLKRSRRCTTFTSEWGFIGCYGFLTSILHDQVSLSHATLIAGITMTMRRVSLKTTVLNRARFSSGLGCLTSAAFWMAAELPLLSLVALGLAPFLTFSSLA